MVDRFDSTSDRRVENNVMRHEYRKLSESEKVEMQDIKDLGLQFLAKLNILACGNCREVAIAKTKIEEAVMWAVKGITK